MNKKIIVNSAVVIIFFIVGAYVVNYSFNNSTPNIKRYDIQVEDKTKDANNIKYIKIAGQDIKVDLALNISEQNKGLSGRQTLEKNEGMLFVFDKPAKYLFWMKDMNFPIDMIWITEDLKVSYIKKNATPESYPESYGPDASHLDAKYVLEVMSGFSETHKLKEGDSVLFTY